MPHYDTGEWSDFVRGLVPSSKGIVMRAHLTECDACRRSADLLGHVAATARIDRELAPPDHLVQWARALFTTRAREPARTSRRLIARLVFDSFAAPELAGVRAQSRASRHLLYEAGTFELDLRIENERGTPRVTLVGQILDREHPERSLSAVSIQIVRGRTEVARTSCNRFGEFQVQYEPDGRLRLYVVEHPGSRRVEVLLTGLGSDQPRP